MNLTKYPLFLVTHFINSDGLNMSSDLSRLTNIEAKAVMHYALLPPQNCIQLFLTTHFQIPKDDVVKKKKTYLRVESKKEEILIHLIKEVSRNLYS